MDAVLYNLMPPESLKALRLTVELHKRYSIREITEKLLRCGYNAVSQISAKGEFFIHGGIVDIFPLTEESPVRIEFWDTQVDTIRSIDVQSQRSVEELEEVVIFPAGEIFLSEDEAAAGLHQIGKDMEKNCRELKEQGKREEAARLRQNVENFRETFQA